VLWGDHGLGRLLVKHGKQKTVYRELPRHTVLERGENYFSENRDSQLCLGITKPKHMTATRDIRIGLALVRTHFENHSNYIMFIFCSGIVPGLGVPGHRFGAVNLRAGIGCMRRG